MYQERNNEDAYSSFTNKVRVALEKQAYCYNISLRDWSIKVNQDTLADIIAVCLVRRIAELDKVEELVTEWKLVQFSRTPFKRSVWNQIKVSWLEFFRRYCGLTAPFWQPELCKVTHYEYVPVTYEKTKLIKIYAPPGVDALYIAQPARVDLDVRPKRTIQDE